MGISRVSSVLLLAVVLCGSANAQVVRGRLLDVDTNEPIVGGILTLLPEDGRRVVSVVTRDDGSYMLRAPGPGRYFVEARRLGYRAWIDGPIELAPGDDWESEYHLASLPVQLDPVEVTASATIYEALLQRVGFYERQKSDFGHFMTRDQIQRRAARRVSDLLSTVPGVNLVPSSGGLSRSSIGLRGSMLSQGGPCHPRVFVDGLLVILGDARVRGTDVYGFPENDTEASAANADPAERTEIALDDFVEPNDIEAIEVYRRASEVPVRFGGTSTATQCGVIVIWTRRG